MSYSNDEDTTIVVSQLMTVWQVKQLLTEEPELCDIHYEIPLKADINLKASPTLQYPDQALSEQGISSRKSRGDEILTLYVEYYAKPSDAAIASSQCNVHELLRFYGEPFDYSSVNANDQFPQRVVPIHTASKRVCGIGMQRSDVQRVSKDNKPRGTTAVNVSVTRKQHAVIPFLLQYKQSIYKAKTLATIPVFPARVSVVDGQRAMSVFLQSTEYTQWRNKNEGKALSPVNIQTLNLSLSFPLPSAQSGMIPLEFQPFGMCKAPKQPQEEGLNRNNQTLGISYKDELYGIPTDLVCFTELSTVDASTCELPLATFGVLPHLAHLSLSCAKLTSSVLFPLPVCGNLDAGMCVDDLALYLNHQLASQTNSKQGLRTQYTQDKLIYTPYSGLLDSIRNETMSQMFQLDLSKYLNPVMKCLYPYTPLLAHCNFSLFPTSDFTCISQTHADHGDGQEGGAGESMEQMRNASDASMLHSPSQEEQHKLEQRMAVSARVLYRSLIRRAFKHVPYLAYYSGITLRGVKRGLGLEIIQDQHLDAYLTTTDKNAADIHPELASPSSLETIFRPVGVPPYQPILTEAESYQVFLAELTLQRITEGKEDPEDSLKKQGPCPPVGSVCSGTQHGQLRELQLTEAVLYTLPRQKQQQSVGFGTLTKQNLSYNSLTPASLLQLTQQPNLEELDVSYNNLQFLPCNQSGFRNQRVLNLSGNHLAGDTKVLEQTTRDTYNVYNMNGEYTSHINNNGYNDTPETSNTSDMWSHYQTRQLAVFQALGTIASLQELDISHNRFSFWPVMEQLIPRSLSSISNDADIQSLSHAWTHQLDTLHQISMQITSTHGKSSSVDTSGYVIPEQYQSPFLKLTTLRFVCNFIDNENKQRGLLDLPSLQWLDVRGNVFSSEQEQNRQKGHWRVVTPYLYNLSNSKNMEIVVTNARLNSTGVITPSITDWVAPVSLFTPSLTLIPPSQREDKPYYTFSSPTNSSSGAFQNSRRLHTSRVENSYNALERLLAVESEDVSLLLPKSQNNVHSSKHGANNKVMSSKHRQPLAVATTVSAISKERPHSSSSKVLDPKVDETKRYTRSDVFHAAIDNAIDTIDQLDKKKHRFYHVSKATEPWNTVPTSARVTGTDILHGNNTQTRRRQEEQHQKESDRIRNNTRTESRLTKLRKAERDQQQGMFVLKTQNSTQSDWNNTQTDHKG